ncbi:protein IMPAIRED IN BABA-INDUCED STERILITY 1 [Citrus clementina]|nr:protein IMPAIRED IN BABA-INDUCED STERILITY 1 [Citrus x clementina]
MGCVSSKKAAKAAGSPVFEASVSKTRASENATLNLNYVFSSKNPSGALDFGSKEGERSEDKPKGSRELKKLKKGSSNKKSNAFSIKLGLSLRHVDAEQIAAGWPAWLTAAAGEAVYGLVPMRAESFEKLEKIGQGTYSSVFRAREVATGKMVALKKVRFDNFQPESIRFMAREIMILRRLDHPNIIKLEGVITSRLSNTIYLVFEYMEHDLAGLSSCHDIKFSEPQVKCYMRQLLHGVEHCHLRGIMHRDIKASNILVNNEGILKLGDFGLANILTSKNKQKLTSRVVTLWYRPPELLMGSTNYNVSVDLWSVGCVFAELLIGKPILKGRTEVEQLHKIFKLCGSPPEEYWKKSKLPHGDMFKPQNPYEGCLRERCKDFTPTAVDLIDTCLSIEPYKRGTASSLLMCEYFTTQPYACDPSSLPKYPPKKEIDAKQRDEARRRKVRARMREPASSKRQRRARQTLQLQEPNSYSSKELEDEAHFADRKNNNNDNNTSRTYKGRGSAVGREPRNPTFDTISETSRATSTSHASHGDTVFTVPTQISASSGFAWAKNQQDEVAASLSLRSHTSTFDTSGLGFEDNTSNLTKDDTVIHVKSKEKDLFEASMRPMGMPPNQSHSRAQSLNVQDYLTETCDKEEVGIGRGNGPGQQEQGKVKFSGPLLSESQKIDEILQRNANTIRHANRRSRFYRER